MTPTGNLYYGHSLGLYTALYAAAVSPYEELLHMVISRGLCMQHCSEAVDSGMMAVMTYDTEAIAYVCEIVTRLGGHIYPANYNSFGETVIGGTTSALAQAKELFNMMNIRSVDVQVCGAFHTKLLKSAAAAFNPECKHFDSHAAEYVYVDQSIKDIPSWTSRLTEQIVRPTDFGQRCRLFSLLAGLGRTRMVIQSSRLVPIPRCADTSTKWHRVIVPLL